MIGPFTQMIWHNVFLRFLCYAGVFAAGGLRHARKKQKPRRVSSPGFCLERPARGGNIAAFPEQSCAGLFIV
jgi:hypothetical protein